MNGLEKGNGTVEKDVAQNGEPHGALKDNTTENVEMDVISQRNEKKAADAIITVDKNILEDENWYGEDEDDDNTHWLSIGVESIQRGVKRLYQQMKRLTRGYFWPVFLLTAYTVYFIYAMTNTFGDDGSIRLLVCTILGVIIITRHAVARGVRHLYYGIVGDDGMSPKAHTLLNKARFISRWVMYAALVSFVAWILVEEGQKNPQNLIGIPGLFCMILVCILFSSNPRKINWHTIIWSLGLLFIFAVCTLKYRFGRDATIWLQNRLTEFFGSAEPAFIFLFGNNYSSLGIAISGFPLAFYVSAFMGLLFYVGALQFVFAVLGKFFKFVVNVHEVEAVAVSASIFLDSSALLLSVRPFLPSVTRSELFAIITSLYSSLGAGSLAFIQVIGIPLVHVLPAMVISAPATFLICNLMVPENRRNKIQPTQAEGTNQKKPSNHLEAFQAGSIVALTFIGNIVAAIFAFMSGMTWVNSTLTWFGDRVGVEGFTIEFIFSYLFYPISLAMGVTPGECRQVAKFLGIRLLAGNVIAFQTLKSVLTNRELYEDYMVATNYTGTVVYDGDDVYLGTGSDATFLEDGFLSKRSEAIVTYSLCGFSSVASVGMMMGALSVFLPKRHEWLSKMSLYALIAGNLANCMTGTFASIFFQD